MGIKIAIDAGHGSETAGKRTPDGYREHWINVKTAYYCEQYLKNKGIETLRVGWDDTNSQDDVDVALTTRQQQIKNAKCDYSISFHANAYGNGGYNSASGVETLIHNNTSYQKDSLKFAQAIQNEVVKGTAQNNRGVKTQNLAMCNCVAMGVKAAALVEIGFMTNQKEATLMEGDAFCKEQGEDVAKGILNYLGISSISSSSTATSSGTTYTVVAGDTLSKIGTKTGIPWKTIAEINDITSPYTIKVGQVLQLTTSTSNSKSYIYKNIDYSLVFNPDYYSAKYADLKKAFGTNATNLFNHFTQYGMKEGRQACATFDVNAYRSRYADLQKAFGNNLPEYYKHYIQYGYKEGRKAT